MGVESGSKIADLKSLKLAGGILPGNLYICYVCGARTLVQKTDQLFKIVFRPFCHHFDGAIRTVFHPARQIQRVCGAARVGPEAHALYVP